MWVQSLTINFINFRFNQLNNLNDIISDRCYDCFESNLSYFVGYTINRYRTEWLLEVLDEKVTTTLGYSPLMYSVQPTDKIT